MNTLSMLLTCSACWLAGQDVTAPDPAKKPAETKKQTANVQAAVEQPLSDAERIARLQRSIENDQKELQTLKDKIDDPDSEFQRAQSEFNRIDLELKDKKSKLQELIDTGNVEDAGELQFHVETLTTQWQLLRERANLAVQERKTYQQKVTALTEKINQAQQSFDQLTGKTPETANASATPTKGDKGTAPDAKLEGKSSDEKQTTKTETTSAPPTPTSAIAGMLVTQESTGQNTGGTSEPAANKKKEESKELQNAKKDAQVKAQAAEQAVEKVQSLNDRLETLRKNIKLDQELLKTARQKVDIIQRTLEALEKEQNHRLANSATRKELEEGWHKLSEERARYEQARLDVRNITNHLNQHQEELTTLQSEQIDALRVADRKRLEAESARQLVADLANPFSPNNLLRWLLHNGPKIIVIVLGMLALHRLVNIVCQRIVDIITRGRYRKRERELENRAQTLAGVVRNVSSLVIWGGGTLMLLDTIYVPVVPLLGGAAVIGLAVAFGAQNLIRDYFTGFMILVEDQYAVNDVVRIGDVSGQVERITLRTTVVRDVEGALHFIPHGTISTVSNMTHGWSRAVFNVGIAYHEKPERVMDIIKQIGREMRRDPDFGPMILDDLEMHGVDNFAESAVTLRFVIKTRPLKQWAVKREVNRRIKNRFDEIGIEFPFPTRTIYHRNVEEDEERHELAHSA